MVFVHIQRPKVRPTRVHRYYFHSHRWINGIYTPFAWGPAMLMNGVTVLLLVLGLFVGSGPMDDNTIIKDLTWTMGEGFHQSLWVTCGSMNNSQFAIETDQSKRSNIVGKHEFWSDSSINIADTTSTKLPCDQDESPTAKCKFPVPSESNTRNIETTQVNLMKKQQYCKTMFESLSTDYSSERLSAFLLHVFGLLLALASLYHGLERNYSKSVIFSALSTILCSFSLVVALVTFYEFITIARALGNDSITWGGGVFITATACLFDVLSTWLWKATLKGQMNKLATQIY